MCSDELTIYGAKGSTAETYAQENSIAFVEADGPLTTITEGNIVYRIVGNKVVVAEWLGTDREAVVVPEKTTNGSVLYKFATEAFYQKKITAINIPSTVTTIDKRVFWNCYNLEQVDLPAELKSIGSYVLQYCYALQDVTIPSGTRNTFD